MMIWMIWIWTTVTAINQSVHGYILLGTTKGRVVLYPFLDLYLFECKNEKVYWKQFEAKCFHDTPVWSVNSHFSLILVHICVVEACEEVIKTSVQTLWPHQDQCTLMMGPSRPVYPANGPSESRTGKRVYWLMAGYLAFTSWPRQYNPKQGHDYSWLRLFGWLTWFVFNEPYNRMHNCQDHLLSNHPV